MDELIAVSYTHLDVYKRQTQYIRDNKAFYSLDAGDGIEAEALKMCIRDSP